MAKKSAPAATPTATPTPAGAAEATSIIDALGLQPHPEGGRYAESWRSPGEGRGACSAIYFLLQNGERSHWHTVDADEIWCHHGGAPLVLHTAAPHQASVAVSVLGVDFTNAERPQAVVPAGHWQAASTAGAWSLVSCVVAPGFRFDRFTLAPPGWHPTRADQAENPQL
jgi:predicted cupin superfamily sugar epimerase